MAPSGIGDEVIESVINAARTLFQRKNPPEDLGGIDGLFTVLYVDGELSLEVYAGVSDQVTERAKALMTAWTEDDKPTTSYPPFGVRKYVYIPR